MLATLRRDVELLAAWADGDVAAARELLGRHTGAIRRFFARKVQGTVDDLVQETMLGCLEGRARIHGAAGFRGYMFGVARKVLYDHLRAHHRIPAPLDPESIRLYDPDPPPSEIVVRRREQNVLLRALRRLPVDTQVLLERYYWQELSGPEVARIYGLGERALRSRLVRAKKALRDAMAELSEAPELPASSVACFETWTRALPKRDR